MTLLTDIRRSISAVLCCAATCSLFGHPLEWNEKSEWFMFAPSFAFNPVQGAARYRFRVLDDYHVSREFEAMAPTNSLAPVWEQVPVGFVSVSCFALDADGNVVGLAGERTFWKNASFAEGSYPPARRTYAEAVRMGLEYLLDCKANRYFLERGKPDPDYDLNCYPSKMHAATVEAMCDYIRLGFSRKDEAMALARLCADYLIATSEPNGAPLAGWPQTYEGTRCTAGKYCGQLMTVYPAKVGSAYLSLYRQCGDARYLAAAKAIAETYLGTQGEDGTWHLKLRVRDGQPIGTNRLMPTSVIAFTEELFQATGDARWRGSANRALAYIEKGPLTTWNWEGQFEDVPPSRPYQNLTKHFACDTAILLAQRFPRDVRRMGQVREILRFAEDQFIAWETPMRKDGIGYRNRPGFKSEWPSGWQAKYSIWHCPAVMEQYSWYQPIDASAAKLVRTFLAAYRATGEKDCLAKARALGDAIVNNQRPDGLSPTGWFGNYDEYHNWINCHIAAMQALQELVEVEAGPFDGASWIADPGSRNPAFAKAFSPRAKVVSATLAVTGVGWYEASLNRRKIGDKVLDPIPTQYDKRVLYSTYDVTDLIADGGNELRILLGNGLYNVQEKCEWGFDNAPWKADPAAIAVLSLRYADGTVERIVTDGSWRVVPSPVLFSCFREGEVVLAEPKLDGSPRAATVVTGPKGRLEPEMAPAAKVVRDVPVVKTETLADGSTVYRMAENMAGWARIRFTGLRKGDIVTIRYDERHPDEGNRLIDRFCRSLPSTNACPELAAETAGFQTDRFVSAGGAEEFYEPRFSYNGFRYVTVKGATPAAKDVVGRFVRTSFPKTGSFVCDDAGFMKVMEATARAYEGNFTDGFPTDCPHREKNGWLGDAALAIPYAALEWGSEANTLAYRNWIRTIADGQSDDGRISSIAPHSGLFHFDNHACAGGPAWGAALTTIPTTLYRYRRDRTILAEAYPAMKKYVTKLLSERTAEGIVNYGLGDWCAVSWEWSKDRNFRTSLGLTSTAYAYCSLRETAAAAKLLGYAADAERFETEAAKLRRAFNAKFYRGGGRYDKNASPTAQATALEFGLAEDPEIPAVRKRLVEAVHEMDDKIDFGIIGSRTVFRQLCEAGAVDLAWKLILRPDYPSYLNMISQDANTLMETFSGNCSHNHIMFGDVGAWAYEYLAGIQVGEGDARTGRSVAVRPFVPKALNHVKASVELVEGRMALEWTKKDGVFTLSLDVPNGVVATVVMPDGKVSTTSARHQELKCPMPCASGTPLAAD